MEDSQIKIVQLEPMRMVSFYGFGESPEALALEQLTAWSALHHLHGRVFGFNNPNPVEGSPEYGYEVWMCVGAEAQTGDARVLEFAGGLYAVLRCPVVQPWEDIPHAWQVLSGWLAGSGYALGAHPCLEEHLDLTDPGAGVMFTLDLYLPLAQGLA